MNRDYISIKINQRALLLHVVNGVSREEARKIAAREVAEEERQQRKHVANNNYTGGGALFRKLSRILSNMYGATQVHEPERGAPISGELALPTRVVNATVEPTPPHKPHSDDVPCGVWTGGSDGSTAVFIPDQEYHGMVDIVTSNWRHSIENNERIRLEREAKWAQRLTELRGGRS
jgi:hypothetical protein